MKRWQLIVLGVILAMATICLSFVTSIEVSGFTPQVFSYHFEKSDIMSATKMSHADLMKAADKLIRYMKGKDGDLVVYANIDGKEGEVFNEREKLHMVDVRDLYKKANILKTISFFIVLAMLVFSRTLPKYKEIFKFANKAIFVIFALFMLIAGAFAFDFQRNFIRFHEIFFDNDLWLLDPDTSILINMVPESYFYGMIMMTSGLFILICLIFIFLYRRTWKKGK